MSNVPEVLLYGLLAAASPGTVVAMLVVLGTERARVNGLVFALGFVLGQASALAFVVVVGSVSTPFEGSGTASAVLALVIAALLFLAAARARRPREPRVDPANSRMEQVVHRLEQVTPRTAFPIGITLGIGVKRLFITAFAASTIALAGLTHAQEFGLGALYVVLATVLVWAPVALYLVAGRSADVLVARTKELVAVKQREVTFYTSLVFAVFFLISGLVQLL